MIKPFKVEISEENLQNIYSKVKNYQWHEMPDDGGWDYGTNLDYMKSFSKYWVEKYDWKKTEEKINKFKNFKSNIEGIDIHFIYEKGSGSNPRPLLLTHGWPGSFVEFVDIIGPLTNPEAYGGNPADAFHVVIPSLPGYGFSDKPEDRGYNPERMADVLASLMERLGYERYGAQGGDWGAIIGRVLAGNYADRLIGLHSNFVLGGPPRGVVDPAAGVPVEELELRQERARAFANESAYQSLQGTKPQSLGYGLNDSPAGLAAWIVEKFHGWSDHDGDLESVFTKDQLLTNVTLYWVTQTITSASRIYYESRRTPPTRPVGFIEVPTGAAIFPKEISFTPRKWAETQYNIVHWTIMPRGGHFAALEQPELLVGDIRDFFRGLR